jgi:hypothetical protein
MFHELITTELKKDNYPYKAIIQTLLWEVIDCFRQIILHATELTTADTYAKAACNLCNILLLCGVDLSGNPTFKRILPTAKPFKNPLKYVFLLKRRYESNEIDFDEVRTLKLHAETPPEELLQPFGALSSLTKRILGGNSKLKLTSKKKKLLTKIWVLQPNDNNYEPTSIYVIPSRSTTTEKYGDIE